jgi:hypothetical protein
MDATAKDYSKSIAAPYSQLSILDFPASGRTTKMASDSNE